MKSQLLRWWYGLATREQRLLLLATPLLLLGAFYWGIWQPLHYAAERNSITLQQLERQLVAFQQVRPLLQQSASGPARTGGTLAQIVSTSARSFNISVSRMQPQNDQLQLVLDDLAFEQLMPWLQQLHYQNGVQLVSLDVAATDNPGIVRVRRMVIE
ncbi:type II secretion system protein GspM [Alishewanella sp. d11]|uniref:type II secretion system protein GspM n=1 Tax=Alishewanella sp. d11 TaxID=3414030 RepID=UPI003BF86EF9